MPLGTWIPYEKHWRSVMVMELCTTPLSVFHHHHNAHDKVHHMRWAFSTSTKASAAIVDVCWLLLLRLKLTSFEILTCLFLILLMLRYIYLSLIGQA